MWIHCQQQQHRGGGGPSGQSTTQTTQTSEPWGQQKPYLTFGFEEAQQQYQSDKPQFFPSPTYVPFSPESELALGMTAGRAMSGSPIHDLGREQMGATLGGEYLMGGNPAYGSMVERAIRPMRREYEEITIPGIASQFEQAGRFGGNEAYQNTQDRAMDTYLRNVGDISSGLAYQNYGDERGRMQQAMFGAPEYAQADYQDIGRLAGVGQAYEGLEGAKLQDAIQRHNFGQNVDQAKLADYMNLIEGQYGGTSTSTQMSPYYGGNPAMQGAGMALLGAQTGSQMFGPFGPFGGDK